MMTLGYDPQRKRFIGTWVGSMMTNMWDYDGELNAAGTVLTLDTVGPKWDAQGKVVEGETAKYQDIIEFKSDDYRLLISQTPGDDGKWKQFMVAHYRRKN